ncbi:MAG: hypothetical protein HYT10_03185 [Candidatus Levybacteria bacterium]|nr:hypothetical protein [Candidatus Levybacteria bacterium]
MRNILIYTTLSGFFTVLVVTQPIYKFFSIPSVPMTTAVAGAKTENIPISFLISPTKITAKKGKTFTVTLILNSGKNKITGADVTLKFSSSLLESSNMAINSSNFQTVINRADNKNGTYRFTGVILTKPLTGKIVLGKITFYGKKEGTAEAVIEKTQVTALDKKEALPTKNNTKARFIIK